MGFNFRKSIKMGPVRANLSKSGVSTSVGVKGARISLSSKGKARATVGIPGTGLSYSKRLGSKKRASATKKTGSASTSSRFAAETTPAAPMKRSWPKTIILTILAFAVVGGIAFAATFLCYAIISLFSAGFGSTIGAKILVFGVPLILATASALIAFFSTRPEAVPSISDTMEDLLPNDTNNIKIESVREATCAPADQYEAALEEAMDTFDNELSAIRRENISISEVVERHKLKDMPDYTFSNVTRATRLDSIFPLVFLDVETTGLYPSKSEIIEVSAIKFDVGMVPTSCFTTFCKPRKPIPEEATAINHITDAMVIGAPEFAQIAPALKDYLRGCNIAGHNIDFDLRFIFSHGADFPANVRVYDTLDLAHLTINKSEISGGYGLDSLCYYYGIWRRKSHSSLSDCYATSKVFTHIVLDKTSRDLTEES